MEVDEKLSLRQSTKLFKKKQYPFQWTLSWFDSLQSIHNRPITILAPKTLALVFYFVVQNVSFFSNTIFVYNNNNNNNSVSSHMYPENPEATRVIVFSMNMEYEIYPTWPGLGTRNFFRKLYSVALFSCSGDR